MIEIGMVVQTAVALLVPLLKKGVEAAAEKAGENSVEGAPKVFGWMKTKLGGRAKEALEDLERDAGSEENQADLRKQMRLFLQAHPELVEELCAFLPQGGAAGDSLVQTVGPGATATQTKGDGNTTTITIHK